MKDTFLELFRLADEHNAMLFDYWQWQMFDEDGEWKIQELTEANLHEMRCDVLIAAGQPLA